MRMLIASVDDLIDVFFHEDKVVGRHRSNSLSRVEVKQNCQSSKPQTSFQPDLDNTDTGKENKQLEMKINNRNSKAVQTEIKGAKRSEPSKKEMQSTSSQSDNDTVEEYAVEAAVNSVEIKEIDGRCVLITNTAITRKLSDLIIAYEDFKTNNAVLINRLKAMSSFPATLRVGRGISPTEIEDEMGAVVELNNVYRALHYGGLQDYTHKNSKLSRKNIKKYINMVTSEKMMTKVMMDVFQFDLFFKSQGITGDELATASSTIQEDVPLTFISRLIVFIKTVSNLAILLAHRIHEMNDSLGQKEGREAK